MPEESMKTQSFPCTLCTSVCVSDKWDNVVPILAQILQIVTCNTSLEPDFIVLHSDINIRKLAQKVHTQWTKILQFCLRTLTVTVSLELPDQRSLYQSWGNVWYHSESSVAYWTFCYHHQVSRWNGAQEIQRNVHVFLQFTGGLRLCHTLSLLGSNKLWQVISR